MLRHHYRPAHGTRWLRAVGLLGLLPATLAAQSLSVSPRLSVMEGDFTAGSIGLRLELGGSTLSGYGHAGLFGVSRSCDLSLPPSCSSPSGGGTELTGGLRVRFFRSDKVYPVLSVGGGALLWSDDDPYRSGVGRILEAELDIRTPAFFGSELSVGLRFANIGQSVSGGMHLYGPDHPSFAGLVVGLVVPLLRD
jgi:hypothetical protein